MLLPGFPKLEIRSVDRFQEGECDAVVLSLVWSSNQGGKAGIGFLLHDNQCQNVAVTCLNVPSITWLSFAILIPLRKANSLAHSFLG
jgi:hypothetical protein